jgi:hypothetical protein
VHYILINLPTSASMKQLSSCYRPKDRQGETKRPTQRKSLKRTLCRTKEFGRHYLSSNTHHICEITARLLICVNTPAVRAYRRHVSTCTPANHVQVFQASYVFGWMAREYTGRLQKLACTDRDQCRGNLIELNSSVECLLCFIYRRR